MRRIRRAIPIIGALGLLTFCIWRDETPARVTSPTGLFSTEDDAAKDGLLNHAAPERLANLKPQAKVMVLSDTYGKDYWACHVRTENGTVGWVLCTSLDYSRKSGI